TDQLKLTALLSTAFRAPAVGELFGFYGNPKLEPQKHKGSELGLQHQSALGRIRAVYFSTDTQNDFGYGPDYKPYNIVKSENKGFELSIAGNAAGWAYQLSAVSQDPRNAETGTALARRSKAYGSVDLTKTALGIDWASKIFWSASRKDSDFNSFVNASYAVVNLTASTLLSPQWRARVKLENAFGARYQLSPLSRRTPLPPSIQGSAKPWATPRFQEHDGSLEQVLSGQPDVVIVGEFNAFMLRKRLESLGLRVIVTALPNTIDDVALVASRVQALLNDAASPSGKASAQSLQASPIGSGDAKTQGLGPNRIVAAAGSHGRLLLLGPNGYGTGRNTIEHSLITRAGWINYIKHNGRVKLDLEAIAADPPDAILSRSEASNSSILAIVCRIGREV
ncbi:MAG: TonB-dependent receptor, partial [Betaproteobacteria bacterium]|nr:TonB-dependent receptor [Betaproteobacteria bacterium]